jgi:hypothetical protein
MRFSGVFTFVISLALLLLSPLSAKQFVQCSVQVNGQKTFKVNSIYPDQKVYLEVNGLASNMGWRVIPENNGQSVRIDGKSFTDLKEYERRTYVNAETLGAAFGYDVDSMQSGLVVNFWTKGSAKSGAAAAQAYSIRVLKKEKTTSSVPDYDTYKLMVEVTNSSATPARLNANQFRMLDASGGNHRCQGSFEIGLPAKRATKVEGIFFSIPRMAAPKELVLVDDKEQPLGKARI